MGFIFILLVFPSYPSPNAQEMNYAIVVIGAVFVFCVVYYYLPGIGGKTFFTGPIRTVDEIIGTNPGQETDLERTVQEDEALGESKKVVIA